MAWYSSENSPPLSTRQSRMPAHHQRRLRAIGAAAVFTAARAVATAREYLADDATELRVACVPRFATVQFDGRAEETTILEVVVFRVAVDSDD